MYYKIKFYVPTTEYNVSIPLKDRQLRLADVEILFTNLYGGATSDTSSKQGRYRAASGEIITEDILLVESITEDVKIDCLKRAIEEFKKEWQQESILVEISKIDNVYFI